MLRKARTREQELEAIGPMYRRLLERVYAGKARRTDAIKAACLLCRDSARKEITNCKEESCPLWAHRPYKEPRNAKRPME